MVGGRDGRRRDGGKERGNGGRKISSNVLHSSFMQTVHYLQVVGSQFKYSALLLVRGGLSGMEERER